LIKPSLKANLLLALLCLIWGSTWLGIKISLTGFPPFWGVCFRFLIAGILLTGLARLSNKIIRFTKLFQFDVIICGIIMYGGSYALVYWGEQYISSGLSSIIFAAMPFYVGIMAHFWVKGEKMTLIRLLGVMLGFAGVYIVFKDNIQIYGENGIYGMIVMAIAQLLSAAGAVIIKTRLADYEALSLTGFQMLVGAACIFPAALMLEKINSIHITLAAFSALLYLALFGSAITFVTYYRLIKSEGVIKTSLIAFITPLVAVIIGAMTYNEPVNKGILIGGAMVAVGVAIVTELHKLRFASKQT
jgi:drug/metabolite transporter (DMT)-like permease